MNNVESKWAATQVETKKTPDLDQMDMEQYQVRDANSICCFGSDYCTTKRFSVACLEVA